MAATINRWKHMLRKFRIAVFNDMVESEKKKKRKKKTTLFWHLYQMGTK